MTDSKLHYIVHVQPANLRQVESTRDNPTRGLTETLPMLPVWVVRPECAKDRMALVYNWTVINGSVKSHTTPTDPLPNTGNHGWAYIEADALMVQIKADASEHDAWTDAAYLFTGLCSEVGPWKAFEEPASDDDMIRPGIV